MFYFLIFKLSIGTQLKITTDFNPFLVIIGDIYQTLLDRFELRKFKWPYCKWIKNPISSQTCAFLIHKLIKNINITFSESYFLTALKWTRHFYEVFRLTKSLILQSKTLKMWSELSDSFRSYFRLVFFYERAWKWLKVSSWVWKIGQNVSLIFLCMLFSSKFFLISKN